jgi:hypothetical protein
MEAVEGDREEDGCEAHDETIYSSPHYLWTLLLQPPIRRCDRLGCVHRIQAGQAHRSVGQHTASSMPPSLAAPHAKTRPAHRLAGVHKRGAHYPSRRVPRMASWRFRHEPP